MLSSIILHPPKSCILEKFICGNLLNFPMIESKRLRRCTTIAFELSEVRLDAIVFRGETWAALQLFRIVNALSISSWETSLLINVLPALSICFLEYDVVVGCWLIGGWLLLVTV